MGIAPKGMEQGSIEFRVLCFLCPHSISLMDFWFFQVHTKQPIRRAEVPQTPPGPLITGTMVPSPGSGSREISNPSPEHTHGS